VTVGVQTPWPIKIISDKGFEGYKKNGKLSDEFKKEVIKVFNGIREKNPHRGVYAGRAYYVSGIKNPPGPRSSSVWSSKIILQEVKKLYDFAIESKFDKRKNAEIGVIFYPFINAGDPVPDKKLPELQFPGGCVTPKRETIVIEALFGADEGVQSFAHDSYIVDLEKMEIKSKDIRHKEKSLRATNELTYETIKVPVEYRDEQALKDEVIISIAKDFQKVIKKYGPHRLEFIQQPEGVIFRECVEFELQEQAKVSLKGKVKVIKNEADLKSLKKDDKVVFVHPLVIRNRNMDLLTDLCFESPNKLVVLFPGSASTAHAGILLRERGHEIIYIGQKMFKDGQMIILKKGEVA